MMIYSQKTKIKIVLQLIPIEIQVEIMKICLFMLKMLLDFR